MTTPQTTPTRDEAVPERPRIEPLLKDGDVVERLKQFRLRWQESGDLTYLGKALVDAIVEIEASRKASAPAPASGGVDAVGRDRLVERALKRCLPLIEGVSGSEDVSVPADDFAVILGLLKATLPNQASAVEARALAAEAAVLAVSPYIDSIVCYASTIDTYDGNRVAKLVNEAAAAIRAQVNNEPGA